MNEINYEELGTIELIKEVEKGDLVALNQLGRRYETGDRIEQDSKKALEAFDKVYKEIKDEVIKYLAGATMGEIYMLDDSFKDEKLAGKYLKESSEYGNIYGRWLYGRYLLGDDFESSRTDEQYKEAAEIFLELFNKAKEESEESVGELAHTLSYIYLNGKGIEKDLYKAKEYAECAYNSSKDEAELELLNAINNEIKESERKKVMVDIKQSDQVLSESKLAQLTAVDFTDGSTLESLMNSLLTSMQNKGIACDAKFVQIKTGNILKSSLEPACIFYHPEHVDDYYYYVFAFKQQGNMGRLFIYKGGNSTQISKENFNQDMKNSGGGILTKTIKLAARGVNAIGKDKSKLQDEQLYYSSFEQNVIDTFHIHNK